MCVKAKQQIATNCELWGPVFRRKTTRRINHRGYAEPVCKSLRKKAEQTIESRDLEPAK